MKKTDLPLSPHLQIYKPQITSILSIGHRISGFCLNFFLLFLGLWVSSLALGEFYYNLFLQFSSFFLISPNALRVKLISSVVWEAVGINLSSINPFGITG